MRPHRVLCGYKILEADAADHGALAGPGLGRPRHIVPDLGRPRYIVPGLGREFPLFS